MALLEVNHLNISFGGLHAVDDFHVSIEKGQLYGLIGPNGAGKTTLFRLIMGLETVDKGEFEVGETVKVSYVDQQHKDIDPNKSVYQVISGGNDLIRMGGRDINARAYLSRFNFAGADQEKLCGVLSGGEKVRCLLSKMMISGANILILDEPTNHLDMESITALNNGLIKFPGVILFTSHDHQFVQTTANRIMEILPNGTMIDKITTYDEYLASDEMARKRTVYNADAEIADDEAQES